MPRDASERQWTTLSIPLDVADKLLANQIEPVKARLLTAGKRYIRTARIKNGCLEFTWTELGPSS